jgi:hypothetical protein
LVVICGQQNYKLNIKHVIAGVIEEGTRKGEVRGLISRNRVVHKIPRLLTSTETDMWVWVDREASIIKIFFAIFKIRFMFFGNDFHWRFYYADRQ